MDTRRGVLCVAMVLGAIGSAGAQPIGTFRWQFSPFCNVITVSVVQQGSIFVLSGVDDNCGAGDASSVTGTAFFNPDGGVGMGLTIVANTGVNLTSSTQISPATFSGTWTDSDGNSGTFTFSPPIPAGGAPRPTTTVNRLTTISQGTAVSLLPGRCYAIFAYGVGAVGDAGRLVTGFLRGSGGQAIVNNAFMMVPGTVNLTSQGGTLGYVQACNLSSSAQTLPAGWTLVTRSFTLP
jgi:hypothetical protein